MMLEPPMNELLDQVVAQRARQIASASEDSGIPLTEKPVTLAIHEVAAGEVELENRAEEPDDGIL